MYVSEKGNVVESDGRSERGGRGKVGYTSTRAREEIRAGGSAIDPWNPPGASDEGDPWEEAGDARLPR